MTDQRCGSLSPAGRLCVHDAGHEGDHRNLDHTWASAERCDAPDTVHNVRCLLPKGHKHAHAWKGTIDTAWPEQQRIDYVQIQRAYLDRLAERSRPVKDLPPQETAEWVGARAAARRAVKDGRA